MSSEGVRESDEEARGSLRAVQEGYGAVAIESYEGGASCGIAEVEDMESRAGSGGGCLPRTGCDLESMMVLCLILFQRPCRVKSSNSGQSILY